jgi:hypothetical protein
MNKLIQFVKSLRLNQIIVVFLAGFVLLISTACGNSDTPTASRGGAFNANDEVTQTNKATKIQSQPEKGGMNRYNDDPRIDDPRVQSKTQELLQNANKSSKRANSPDNPGEFFEEQAESAGQTIDRVKRNVSQGSEQGTRNLKSNLDRASKNVRGAAEEASDTAQDAAKATQRAVENTADRVRDSM